MVADGCMDPQVGGREGSPGKEKIFFFFFSRQGFSVALEHVLELALVGQTGFKLTEIHLPLSP